MISEYIYSKKDLLESPQKYQKSPFEGIDFLKAYRKNRLHMLEICDLTHFTMPNFQDSNISKKSISGNFKLEDLLLFLLNPDKLYIC